MLSVNVCQMVQDAGLYGVMTTGLKCHQARCNQSVGHSSTIWDLSPCALSEPVLNLGHGLRGVSAKAGKLMQPIVFLARTFKAPLQEADAWHGHVSSCFLPVQHRW